MGFIPDIHEKVFHRKELENAWVETFVISHISKKEMILNNSKESIIPFR